MRELRLHHVDGLRQQARGRGLDHVPRVQAGAIEYPDGTFRNVTVQATRSEVLIEELGWRFERAAAAPRCLARRAHVGRLGVAGVRVGLTRAQLLRGLPQPRRRSARSWRWCVEGGGRVAAAIARSGRVALVSTTAPRHRFGRIHPGRPAGRPGPALVRAGSRLIGIRRGKVRFLAVTRRSTIAKPRTLRLHLRQAGAT